ncbi:MAG: acyl-CoA/acyl-ACP dehydrogenase [Chloroflexi bacterium]|nr:acyl-CoA/acyl-ACP dehydrogenase [Chloroflexota bacterium]MCH8869045.1 acyl-CoA/acyl-ACP dehydrogenase [Chloroflexota bacterium]MCH9038332.1 acyl-CoA/acyl-ACP dehydrogenase [Chloroflexota bacterium]MCI0790575.1 acyl-CoA/acyl-ACP dehydrogenase [Chloroflexota bacterium]MCI0812801.1 acyl-CoA/acyl-ACP dehydrogenase [Chloroflexota bacterium]
MDLGLNEAQQMLKNSAREFLDAECPTTYVREMEEDERGYSPEMWRKVAEQGWLGLIFPEQYGGFGMNFLDLSILLEEAGRVMLPGPMFSTVVMGGMTILDAGSDEQKQELLPQIGEGQLIVTLALTEPSARWDALGVETSATQSGDGWTINGTKLFVPNAHVSDTYVVAARTGDGDRDISLFLVPSNAGGVSQTLLKTIASDRQSEVVLNNVGVPASALLGEANKGWDTIEKVLAWGAIGKCAEMVGGAQEVLDMTVEFAKQRTQFGRPIGSFQAIQHHCANMATDVEGSRYITYQAAWRLSEGLPAQQEVAMAKAWVSDAYRRVCALGHQCHGAIGFTKEHNMQLYSRRAKAAELAFGDTDHHLEAVAEAIGL